MSAGLERIAEKAKAKPRERFTALAHHLSEEMLKETFVRMNQRGAPGVDRVSMAEYAQDVDAHVADLVERMKRRAYDAPYVRRTYIPKAGNPAKLRPLGIPTVEDRLLQAAISRILGTIYEPIFRECSFGFRPGRRAHDALRQIRATVMDGEAQYVLEVDIRGYFDHIDHGWLLRMLELKVGDPWILRLIRKWLKAGICDKGIVTHPEEGTPQGGPLSPLLANVYLHYALDLWFEKVVRPRLRGGAKLVRYADDFLLLFADERDARVVAGVLPKRLAKFGLEVAPEKTRLVPFGSKSWRQGKGASGTFDFLGFSHHIGTSRRGGMIVVRVPAQKSVHRFLMEVKGWLRTNLHWKPTEQQAVLAAKLRGFYQYFGLRLCLPRLDAVRVQVRRYWQQALARRSQRAHARWSDLSRRPWFQLPSPRLVHPTV